jgi:hypothetical protein
MKTIYLHIGLWKTGTTFLQKMIFPKLKNVNYIIFRNDKEMLEVMDKLRFSILSNDDSKKLQLVVSTKLLKDRNLISAEGLSGSAYFVHDNYRSNILKNIEKVFTNFNVKIILGIREQSSIIVSLYKQYLYRGGTKSLTGFIDQMNQYQMSRKGEDYFKRFEYGCYIDEIIKIFGKDNLYIYSFEELNKDKYTFLKNLLDFLGEKEVPEFEDIVYNRGYGKIQIKLARFLNRFFKSDLNPNGILHYFRIPMIKRISQRDVGDLLQSRLIQKLIYKEYRMPYNLKLKIKKRYIQDNKRINEKYGLNLPDIYFST